jgi:ABC-type multidrug transport system permease subunit
VQYKVLLVRYFKAYWRSPPYNTTRLILALCAALMIGSAYWSRGNNYGTTADVTNILGALFISVMFIGSINFQMIVPTFFMERPVMWRERASRFYAVLPWVQAMQDVEVPWILCRRCSSRSSRTS